MAIFGAGSKWEDDEMKDDFFRDDNYVIGWHIKDAEDLYSLINSIKIGDILYLKANRPGLYDLRIKGIGIVKDSLLNILFEKGEDLSTRHADFKLPVEWIYKSEFKITIPHHVGKLTNIRAATLYEEYLPYVQKKILQRIFQPNKKLTLMYSGVV